MSDTRRKPSFADMKDLTANLGEFLTVAKRAKADYRTIQAAVNAAPPNSVIEIQDNSTYREEVVITKGRDGLTLRGKADCWPVLQSPGDDVNALIVVRSPRTTVQRVILLSSLHCVRVEAAPVRLLSLVAIAKASTAVRSYMSQDAQCALDRCCLVGSTLATERWNQLSVKNSFVLRGELNGGHLDLQNVFAGSGVKALASLKARSCTITHGVRCQGDKLQLLDSIVSHVEAERSGARIDHCNVYGKGYLLTAKPGKGCLSADPRFLNPRNVDYRLSKTSPCRGKALEGGDLGVRYTPEMIEVLKRALEICKREAIKF